MCIYLKRWVKVKYRIYNSVAILGEKKIYTDRESGEKHSENLQLYALFYRILISFNYNYTHCLPIFAHLLLKHDKNIAVNEGIYNSVV